jgi:hypothetical protein
VACTDIEVLLEAWGGAPGDLVDGWSPGTRTSLNASPSSAPTCWPRWTADEALSDVWNIQPAIDPNREADLA